MKHRYRIFMFTVLISSVSLLLPLAASAAVSGDFRYTDNGATVTIDGCSASPCPTTPLTIPATIDGDPVTRIAGWAFADSSLTSITIPSSVTNIDSAFGEVVP